MQIGAYTFGRSHVVRAFGNDSDVARGLFGFGEPEAQATIHFSQSTGEQPTFWAERTFQSRYAALAFLFAQAIRFGLQKRTWI